MFPILIIPYDKYAISGYSIAIIYGKTITCIRSIHTNKQSLRKLEIQKDISYEERKEIFAHLYEEGSHQIPPSQINEPWFFCHAMLNHVYVYKSISPKEFNKHKYNIVSRYETRILNG